MYTSLSPELHSILELARLAPSVHNVQPWKMSWDDGQLTISVATNRMLKDGDPTLRELWISMGAFIETVIAAAEASGFELKYDINEDPRVDTVVATMRLGKAGTSKPELEKAIRTRASDRQPYAQLAIEPELIARLQSCWKSKTAVVKILHSQQEIAAIADMTAQGIAMALSLPGFRSELAELIRPNESKARTGLFGYALGYGSLRARMEPWLVRSGYGRIAQSKREGKAWARSGAIAVVLTPGDTAPFWLEAGRAYARLGLVATEAGLHLSTSAAVVEASDFHLEIEKLCATPNLRLQTVMRLGYGLRPARTSPRLDLGELFD